LDLVVQDRAPDGVDRPRKPAAHQVEAHQIRNWHDYQERRWSRWAAVFQKNVTGPYHLEIGIVCFKPMPLASIGISTVGVLPAWQRQLSRDGPQVRWPDRRTEERLAIPA